MIVGRVRSLRIGGPISPEPEFVWTAAQTLPPHRPILKIRRLALLLAYFRRHGLIFWTIAIPAVTAVYFALAKAGLSMAFMVEQVSLVWPPTGFALACVLLLGHKVWPAIAAGAFLVNATANESVATAAGIAFGNTLEAILGAWMLRRASFDHGLRRVSDVVKFIVLAAAVSTSASATVGALSLCLGEAQSWSAFAVLWRTWWLGDAIGDLIVAPVLLTSGGWRLAWPRRRWTELMLLLAGLSITCLVVFTERWNTWVPGNSLAFAAFPFAIWAALRFGQQGAAVTVASASLAIFELALCSR